MKYKLSIFTHETLHVLLQTTQSMLQLPNKLTKKLTQNINSKLKNQNPTNV